MNSRIWAAVLAVVFTCGLSALVVDQIHAAVTCSASAYAGRESAGGSVTPGASDLPIDHEKGNEYEGKASVVLSVNGIAHRKVGKRIWVVVKEETLEYQGIVETSATLEAGMEVDADWKVFDTTFHADESRTVKYTISVEVTQKQLWAETRDCSHSASGEPWHYKDAYAFGNCDTASDADGFKRYRPPPSSGSSTVPGCNTEHH